MGETVLDGSAWARSRARSVFLIALGVGLVVAVTAADAVTGEERVIIGLVLVGPFTVALTARPRMTTLVSACALAAVCLSILWDESGGDWDYWARVLLVAFGSLIAVVAARAQRSEIGYAELVRERAAVADTLEAALVPGELPEIEGWRLASLYRPAQGAAHIGGDFYDAYRVARGWMLVVGDVVGHGASAAALTGLVRYTLRATATLTRSVSQALAKLDRDLRERRPLAPCAVGYARLHTRGEAMVDVVCAGIPCPLLVRDGQAVEAGQHGPLVGAFPNTSWRPTSIPVHSGDILVLYTDGVLDLRGARERFGEARLAETLAPAAGAEDAVTRLASALDAFAEAQEDDIVVLAIERVAPADGQSVSSAFL
jgi:uncharacterized membrane protein